MLACLLVRSSPRRGADVAQRAKSRGWTTMTKAELIDEVSKLSNLTKKETETIVNTVFDNITDALAKGDKVELRGFGSFRIRHRNSRKGRNPKTGSAVDVPEKRVPFFKVGKRLRELVNT
ncbi:MAG TPA: integration host factor subunit beta [Candidatus Acidoferrum sp.]|nr:integration host factor subunit beta [Candidatus Acidoferrum sp.]